MVVLLVFVAVCYCVKICTGVNFFIRKFLNALTRSFMRLIRQPAVV